MLVNSSCVLFMTGAPVKLLFVFRRFALGFGTLPAIVYRLSNTFSNPWTIMTISESTFTLLLLCPVFLCLGSAVAYAGASDFNWQRTAWWSIRLAWGFFSVFALIILLIGTNIIRYIWPPPLLLRLSRLKIKWAGALPSLSKRWRECMPVLIVGIR